MLPSREDVHTAVEVEISGRWLLVDATHDPPLARGGLTVSEWDGIGETMSAYPPQGPLWREGRDDAMIANALATIAARLRACHRSRAPRIVEHSTRGSRFCVSDDVSNRANA